MLFCIPTFLLSSIWQFLDLLYMQDMTKRKQNMYNSNTIANRHYQSDVNSNEARDIPIHHPCPVVSKLKQETLTREKSNHPARHREFITSSSRIAEGRGRRKWKQVNRLKELANEVDGEGSYESDVRLAFNFQFHSQFCLRASGEGHCQGRALNLQR